MSRATAIAVISWLVANLILAYMAAREAKRARLLTLRHKLPYMSQSALAGIIQEAQRDPLPLNVDRGDIRMARDEIVFQSTPYGPLHTKVSSTTASGPRDIEFCAPLPML